MKPNHIARARRLVTKRWYILLRIRKFKRAFRHNDRKLYSCSPRELGRLTDDMSRFAVKQEWYVNKLKNTK
ncbi:MAG: hypothetical protein II841_08785 [Bacteroidales bacterium]|nr:hypothetical protein [Bacteroidales bacterium]